MSHFTVPELKSYLEEHHLSQDGKKPELVKRYQRHVSLLQMSLNELKTECEDAHISRNGTKADIIIRLMGDDAIPITRHSERPASPRVVPQIEQIYAQEAAIERSRSCSPATRSRSRSRSPAPRARSRSPAPRARSRSKSPARVRDRSKSPAPKRDRSKSPAPRSPKAPRSHKPKTKADDKRKDKPVTRSVEKEVELGPLLVSPFVNIASATDGQPCISVYDPIIRTRVSKDGDYTSYDKNADSGEGRVVIDCGFTKLYYNWDDAGTARYVVNATCWLYAMERLRAQAEAPTEEAKAPAPAPALALAPASAPAEAKMDTSEQVPAILRRTPSNTHELSWDEQERQFALKYYNPAFGLPLPPLVAVPTPASDANVPTPTPVTVADVPRDRHLNPVGPQYDLARDDAFVGFTVIIANFLYTVVPKGSMESGPIAALRGKGFTVFHIDAQNNMQQCIEKIQTSDTTKTCIWIISTKQERTPNNYVRDFVPVLDQHHEKGGGIFAFGDNDPLNVVVNEWLNRFGVCMTGNYQGSQQLTFDIDFNDDWRVRGCNDINKPTLSKHGAFGSHLIFTGVSRLFEGITICHPALLPIKRIPASAAIATTMKQV